MVSFGMARSCGLATLILSLLSVIVQLSVGRFVYASAVLTTTDVECFFTHTALLVAAILVNTIALLLMALRLRQLWTSEERDRLAIVVQLSDEEEPTKFDEATERIRRDQLLDVLCGTFVTMTAFVNLFFCVSSALFTDSYLRDGIELNMQAHMLLYNRYGFDAEHTASLDAFQRENNCCGIEYPLAEFRRSGWFRAQREWPRRPLPDSCVAFRVSPPFGNWDSRSPGASSRRKVSVKLVWKNNNNNDNGFGCFTVIRRRAIRVGVVLGLMAMLTGTYQLGHGLRLLRMALS